MMKKLQEGVEGGGGGGTGEIECINEPAELGSGTMNVEIK